MGTCSSTTRPAAQVPIEFTHDDIMKTYDFIFHTVVRCAMQMYVARLVRMQCATRQVGEGSRAHRTSCIPLVLLDMPLYKTVLCL